MTAPDRPRALVFTLAEFSKHPSRIIKEVEDSGQPAFITRHGQFTAIITPVAGHVVSRVLTEMARELGRTAALQREDGVTHRQEGSAP